MTEHEDLVARTVRLEGLRLKPYKDTVGKWTLGVGRNITDKGISRAEALFLLDNDLDEVTADLATFPWFHKLDPVRMRVLIDMRFQLGELGLRRFKRTLASIVSGDYVTAGEQMLQSKAAKQTPARWRENARWMKTGVAE